MLPAALGTKGQPPRPPKEVSNWVMPASMAARMLAMARPRVLWKCSHQETWGYFSATWAHISYTWLGTAMPEVSDREISVMPTFR